ncbi:Mtc4p Ecym_4399 [Eremothecium cymbalariae DBVPG|uniref:Maintenance of telomere capping protein 4 n=1 Tax=Eremothecium cymbalariae (strain CBS 270.75 / DBVPG 7215 / KCTC 17166 / NRRL Y-17582) TaxID=931890 RepID=G8JTV0_ERECY|nr:hypothetical protein Ecym_4399 [Eremothecium cymbalariae DBVPG\
MNPISGLDNKDIELNHHKKDLYNATKLLLDIKSGFMRDMNVNIDQPLSREPVGYGNATFPRPPERVFNCSRKTREKAEATRVYLELFYVFIDKSIRTTMEEKLKEDFEGFEGVYNPLQTIRNRKLRKKYKRLEQKYVSLSKRPVIAVVDFSHRHKHFPWFVDIQEKSRDSTWRASHWHELRKPDGSYWFKSKNLGSQRRDSQQSHNDSVSGVDSDEQNNGSINNNHSETAMVPTIPKIGLTTDTEENEQGIQQALNKSHLGDQGCSLEKIDAECNGTDYLQVITANLTPDVTLSDYLHPRSGRRLKNALFSRLSKSPAKSNRSSVESQLMVVDDDLTRLRTQYKTPIDEQRSYSTSSVFGQVKIASLKKKLESLSEEPNLSPQAQSSAMQDPNSTLILHMKQSKYLKCTYDLIKQKDYNFKEREESMLNNSETIQRLCTKISECLPKSQISLQEYDESLDKALEVCRTWESLFLNEYSVRVDTLVSNSDRILSEINTTLTLRVKELQEDMDRSSIIRNIHGTTIPKFLYKLLECAIVSVLWIIWFFFFTMKTIRSIVVIVFKGLRWLLLF